MKQETAPTADGGDSLTLDQWGELLKSRRTVNFFEPDPVPRELLLQAIEVARWAPNHKLTEPWHFYLPGARTVTAIIDLIVELKAGDRDESARRAVRDRLEAIPGWFVLTCRNTPESPVQQQEDYAACACAMQNLMLYLWHAGVGVKWTTGQATRNARLYEILDLDGGRERIVGLFWYGYPQAVPPPRERRETAEIWTSLP